MLKRMKKRPESRTHVIKIKKDATPEEFFRALFDTSHLSPKERAQLKNKNTEPLNLNDLNEDITSEKYNKCMAQVLRQYFEEENNPELTINRAIDSWKSQGYSDEWIYNRIDSLIPASED